MGDEVWRDEVYGVQILWKGRQKTGEENEKLRKLWECTRNGKEYEAKIGVYQLGRQGKCGMGARERRLN